MPGGDARRRRSSSTAPSAVGRTRRPTCSPTSSPRCAAMKAARRGGRPAGAHRAAGDAQPRPHPRPRARDASAATSCCTARRSRSVSCSPARSPARWSASTPTRSTATATWSARSTCPTAVPGGRSGHVARDELVASMQRDKKAVGGLTFVLPGPARARDRATIPTHARSTSRSPRSVWEADPVSGTILLLSGPNLNLLGDREPEIYGTDHARRPASTSPPAAAAEHGYALEHLQSNHEGDLVDAIHGARGRCDAIVHQRRRVHALLVRARRRPRDVRRREGRAAHLQPRGARAVAPRLR